jgi:hypothetical protein
MTLPAITPYIEREKSFYGENGEMTHLGVISLSNSPEHCSVFPSYPSSRHPLSVVEAPHA